MANVIYYAATRGSTNAGWTGRYYGAQSATSFASFDESGVLRESHEGVGFAYDVNGFFKLGTITSTYQFGYDGELTAEWTNLNVDVATRNSLLSSDRSGYTFHQYVFRGNENILGWAGSDSLMGSRRSDPINGGAGVDVLTFRGFGSAVNVDLATGKAVTSSGTSLLSGIEDIEGSAYGDTLTGNAMDNQIQGFGGADTINGGTGFDTAIYLDATSAINVNLATGVVSGGSGADRLVSIERVTGSRFNDVLTGSIANETFVGGLGVDTINGGNGVDTVEYSSAGSAVVVNLAVGKASGGGGSDVISNIENITGSVFSDTLTGNSAANVLNGGNGNDTLNGGAGADTMNGGNGNDTYVVDNAGDKVSETNAVLASGGSDTVNASISYTLGTNVENLRLTAAGIKGTGNALNNMIYAGAGNNAIDGGAGIDTLSYMSASGGIALTLANTGQATAWVFSGTDTVSNIENITGSNLGDNLGGNDADNVLIGNAGNDRLYGNGGADRLDGGAGDDWIEGGDGNDVLLGGAGWDDFIGGAGNDTIDGGAITDSINQNDTNSVRYATSTSGINVNLATGVAQDGFGGTDKLINIIQVFGSSHDDTIIGSTSLVTETFDGGAGNDTLDGGAVTDTLNLKNANRISYQNATASVNLDLMKGTATSGGDTDILRNFTHARGSDYSDELRGSDSTVYTEQFEGQRGDDFIDGRGGTDVLRYVRAPSAVTVNLADGTASDGYGTIDTFVNMEGVRGSSYDDTLIGGHSSNGTGTTDGFESFMGLAGNDTIDGAGGYDEVGYWTDIAGVVVALGGTANGTARDGFGGTDTLISIEAVSGSEFNDTLTGSDTAAFESFEGRAGNDVIDGKGGTDRADYTHATSAVTVTLGATSGTAADGYGTTDTLRNIENVRGSRDCSDSITGNAVSNKLEGLGGHDKIDGGAGSDTLLGGAGNDRLAGGTGNDMLYGEAGQDIFIFNTGLSGNIDQIRDFSVIDDTIHLENAIFSKLTAANVTLSAGNFRASAAGTAADNNDYILYDTDSGALYYDADGNGAGAAIRFATLSGLPAITSSDFFVI